LTEVSRSSTKDGNLSV